ncbi:GTPase HflX [Oceanobacillus profundus]|uniref:GTPase HflX n=1 Tax=Oceanobacillus TaxID=182709 RepID=UPI000BA4FDD5|nr:GTPase HflX [Oceanobacillus profundus]MCM3399792.1 GTPase HflX [Oceanobacillus profundus]MDO6449957.1 GTPase HflX [Oceanobacillus profundus]PAE28171.1 GTPase HflX [Paenibacillus sp. 7884-2]
MNKKAILVGVNISKQEEEFAYSMEELGNLAEACHIDTVGELRQNLNRINQGYYLGTGKMDELKEMAEAEDADMLIFDDELSPSQIRNIEEATECQVVDRTMLILEIFANRAKTRESKLQVEVARLKYMLPRLIGSRESLGRQGGGSGLINRGSGETKLETDRRKIEEQIAKLNRELENLVNQRKTQRKQREKNDVPVVSLVGYTNAGKSTTMNAVLDIHQTGIDKQVFEKDMLFATLETSVRKVELETNQTFLLTDTVGFINKLPHHLVKAFRSTLEEVIEADLLIHVLDVSNPNYEEHCRLTHEILAAIGVTDIPMIYAYNKADQTEMNYPVVENNRIYLSAKKRTGIRELLDLIKVNIFKDNVICELLIPYSEGQIVSYLNDQANILEEAFEEKGTRLRVECKPSDAERFKQYLIDADR